ncbi:alpha-glucosidase [Sphingomonas sp. BN140010]|uniref:Alpha-glucosidase n=1 Tax=Sphingomonas arvum TaxID=2992113 RepID=A0ABT3JET4_9SPHN|nr:alpha-glucosidase [Sphingomonas sp. BN140010]MCW3797586.1 alpha-glucosidase [Sphingomonas sp. BN140010]
MQGTDTIRRLQWRERDGRLQLALGEHILLDSSRGPLASVGRGQASVAMYRGNFDISDSPTEVTELAAARLDGNAVLLAELQGGEPLLALTLADHPHADGVLEVRSLRADLDRIWLRLSATEDENLWGGGEQMSYLRLNGRRFPMWTSEPGVGRDKSDPFTQAMDAAGNAGGDYWTTNYPQPTFLSSRGYAVHADVSSYSVLDFIDAAGPTLELWQGQATIEFTAAPTLVELVSRLSIRFGRQPPLPDWAIGGAIVGLKEGQRSFERLDRIIAAGASISALWCEDWAGIRETSFGRRLFWNWTWNAARYPDLPRRIKELRERGVRFMAYANPYLAVDGTLYREAAALGHLALAPSSDEPYAVDFGEFDAGVVDFTRDESRRWFADRVLGRELLDIGIDGWMADFGEYLPTDVRLASGEDPMRAHNRWPVLWAEVNDQALRSRGRRGDALFFMRAGFSGVQAHCPLLWAGDQSVDFSRHDGINTVITAALSAGLVGNAYSHSDCGGYTSLGGKVRTAELMMRWCELAAFAPVMRTHEGNRPDENLQVDSTPELLACFAAWSRVHAALAPYVRHLCDQAVATGLPAQRPLFLHYPDDPDCAGIQDQYLYGEDLLVAPVVEEGATGRRVYLPEGDWVHVWNGSPAAPGWTDAAAPLGSPPVYHRRGSTFAGLFGSLPAALAGAA